MKQYKVKHVVLCEVHTYRIVEAESIEAAMVAVSQIQTVTAGDSAMSCDYEIVADVEVKAVTIKENRNHTGE